MKANIEKEYKILVTKEQFTTLLKEFPDAEFHKQVNTYYDTADLKIKKTYGAMRIREVKDTYLFTLKEHTSDGLLEHEMEVSENTCSALNQPAIQALLERLQVTEPLQAITTLTTYRAMVDTGLAELCFDYSQYGGKEDFEIEYEYKRPHDGKSVFNRFLAHVGLTYEQNCKSKIQRALDEWNR